MHYDSAPKDTAPDQYSKYILRYKDKSIYLKGRTPIDPWFLEERFGIEINEDKYSNILTIFPAPSKDGINLKKEALHLSIGYKLSQKEEWNYLLGSDVVRVEDGCFLNIANHELVLMAGHKSRQPPEFFSCKQLNQQYDDFGDQSTKFEEGNSNSKRSPIAVSEKYNKMSLASSMNNDIETKAMIDESSNSNQGPNLTKKPSDDVWNYFESIFDVDSSKSATPSAIKAKPEQPKASTGKAPQNESIKDVKIDVKPISTRASKTQAKTDESAKLQIKIDEPSKPLKKILPSPQQSPKKQIQNEEETSKLLKTKADQNVKLQNKAEPEANAPAKSTNNFKSEKSIFDDLDDDDMLFNPKVTNIKTGQITSDQLEEMKNTSKNSQQSKETKGKSLTQPNKKVTFNSTNLWQSQPRKLRTERDLLEDEESEEDAPATRRFENFDQFMDEFFVDKELQNRNKKGQSQSNKTAAAPSSSLKVRGKNTQYEDDEEEDEDQEEEKYDPSPPQMTFKLSKGPKLPNVASGKTFTKRSKTPAEPQKQEPYKQETLPFKKVDFAKQTRQEDTVKNFKEKAQPERVIQKSIPPIQKVAQPIQKVTQPIQKVAQPIQKVTQPIEKPIQLTHKAIQPVQKPAQTSKFRGFDLPKFDNLSDDDDDTEKEMIEEETPPKKFQINKNAFNSPKRERSPQMRHQNTDEITPLRIGKTDLSGSKSSKSLAMEMLSRSSQKQEQKQEVPQKQPFKLSSNQPSARESMEPFDGDNILKKIKMNNRTALNVQKEKTQSKADDFFRVKTDNPPPTSSLKITKENPRNSLQKKGTKESNNDKKETCLICLGQITDEIGRLDSCRHIYCYSCVLDWSKVTNECPLCKSKFHEIAKYVDEENIIESVLVEDKKQEYKWDWENYFEESKREAQCTVCHSNENIEFLVCCLTCHRVWCHTYCTIPPLESIWDEYKCKGCQRAAAPQTNTTTAAGRGRGGGRGGRGQGGRSKRNRNPMSQMVDEDEERPATKLESFFDLEF